MLSHSDRGRDRYLINSTLAQRFFAGENPVGQKLLLDADAATPHEVQIAGVVGDVRDLGLDVDVQPTLYEIDTSPVFTLFLDMSGSPSSAIPMIRDVIRRTNPEATIARFETVDALVGNSVARYRFALWLMGGFAFLGTVLSAVGVYGVVAFSVGYRVREFGIRSAMGARPFDLAALVLRNGVKVSLAGLAVGILLTWIFWRFIRALLFQTGTTDPIVLTVAGLLLVCLCIGAMLIPAIRASATTPAVVLREE